MSSLQLALCMHYGTVAFVPPMQLNEVILAIVVTIRREIGNYREDCEKLDRDQRLHDSISMKKVWR